MANDQQVSTIGRRVGAVLEIVAAIAGLFVAAAMLGAIVAPLLPAKLVTPVLGLSMWGAVFAGWLLLRRSGSSYSKLGLARPISWSKSLGWAAVAVVASELGVAGLGVLIHAATDWPPLDTRYIRLSIEGDPLAYLVWITLVVWGSAAFGEELLARGFLLDRLRIVFGGKPAGMAVAILLQAAIFGALHAVQGPTGMVLTAYVGVVLALVYVASGRNLWAPIIAHGFMDSTSLTLMFFGIPLWGYIK